MTSRYLGHELEAALDPRQGLLLQDAGLVRRHDGRVNEAQEHGAAHRANAVLWETLTHHLREDGGKEGRERLEQSEGRTNRGKRVFQYLKSEEGVMRLTEQT